MTEDSGAFKTNPANLGQIPAFVMTRERRCSRAALARKRIFADSSGHSRRRFNKRWEVVALFSNRLIRSAGASRTRPNLSSPRSRWLKGLCK
jgi:hypothetical protein